MADADALHSTEITRLVGSEIDGSEQLPISSTDMGSGKIGLDANPVHSLQSSYSPDWHSEPVDVATPIVDYSGRLETHSTVLSDEGSIRDDFTAPLKTTLTGTLSFVNGQTLVTGSGTLFTSELQMGQYIKLVSHSEIAFAYVDYIQDDENLSLDIGYTGSTASGSAEFSTWSTRTGAGASISVANSICTIALGTNSSAQTELFRLADYLPFNFREKLSISQRIANQTIQIGFFDNIKGSGTYFEFSGTNPKSVACVTKSLNDPTSTTTSYHTFTGTTDTSQNLLYQIDLTGSSCIFSIEGKIIAKHTDHLPGPYDIMEIAHYGINSGTVTNTNLNIDSIWFSNIDRVEITNSFSGDPVPSLLYGISSVTGFPTALNLDSNGNLIVTALTGFNANFSFGDVATTGTSQQAMRRTTYVEQTVGGQRSIASANANDTAAGTGAQQVTIKYYDQTGLGPYYEVLTLNGTTGVNTIATNICFIESMIVTRVGSGNVNAGIISLYTAINKGGVVNGTIAASDNRTFWAHHYVPQGYTCKITGIAGSTDQTSSAYCILLLKAKLIGVIGASEFQVSDSVRVYGGAAQTVRQYGSPILVTGPARVLMYASPSSNSQQTTFGSFDFFEPTT